jgi:curli biogenesis system outer membrane secretion channel CsgG
MMNKSSKYSCTLMLVIACSSLAAQNPKKIPLVAVMPISGQGVDSASAQVVSDVLSNELLRTGKVRVMERSQMEKILKEQGFQQSGSCDGSECAVEMGKLLSIDKMVVGSLGKLGGSYSVSLRAVDVSTGEIVGSSQKMQRGEIDEVSASLLPGVAKELASALNPEETKVVTNSVKPTVAAPVVTTLPEPTSTTKSEPVASKEKSSSHLGWWIAGGVAVAGGATAAVLLLSGKDSSPATTPAATTSNTDITAKWAN